jgi:hypothetical protein
MDTLQPAQEGAMSIIRRAQVRDLIKDTAKGAIVPDSTLVIVLRTRCAKQRTNRGSVAILF